jgi:hypothetical protein
VVRLLKWPKLYWYDQEYLGGLSAESVDIAEANRTDLIRNATDGNIQFGGLSAESVDIAEANRTDLIRNATNNNETDFGGLSARSVNITK